MPCKYVLVSGGVLSGLGKGIVTSSIGRMFIEMDYTVCAIKIDPYLNIDAGTMSPFEHGEVYVLEDGGEVDLDLGNYERYMDLSLTRDNNITTGKIYKNVIEKERRGEYLGKTVMVVPHICDEIKTWIENVATKSGAEICLIEMGGTVGDMEGMPFLEALRQFQYQVGKNNFCHVLVTLVPVIGVVGEQKTKPAQQSVKEIRSLGLSPDVIVCRSEKELAPAVRQKLSAFCHLSEQQILGLHNVSNLYSVPSLLVKQGLHLVMSDIFNLKNRHPTDLFDPHCAWQQYSDKWDKINSDNTLLPTRIAIVGKYTELPDSYLSVSKALEHAAIEVGCKLEKVWIEATDLENNNLVALENLHSAHGILVPGGFGSRGVEGKIHAIGHARRNHVPFLGICVGFQLAVVEYARDVLGWRDANSTEFDPSTEHPVVCIMSEHDNDNLGGTLKLGAKKTIFNRSCKLLDLYHGRSVIERHRHRYEVNPECVQELENAGLDFVGEDANSDHQHILELRTDQHPYFVALQQHAEFNSRPTRPSPPFVGFMQAAKNHVINYIVLKDEPLIPTSYRPENSGQIILQVLKEELQDANISEKEQKDVIQLIDQVENNYAFAVGGEKVYHKW